MTPGRAARVGVATAAVATGLLVNAVFNFHGTAVLVAWAGLLLVLAATITWEIRTTPSRATIARRHRRELERIRRAALAGCRSRLRRQIPAGLDHVQFAQDDRMMVGPTATRTTLADILGRSKRVILVGSGGTGKSYAAARWVADHCKESTGPLPVWISPAACSAAANILAESMSPSEAYLAVCRVISPGSGDEALAEYLAAGKPVAVVLDEFNTIQVGHERLGRFLTLLSAAVTPDESSRLIVTSRTEPRVLAKVTEPIEVVAVHPFDSKQRWNYFSAWRAIDPCATDEQDERSGLYRYFGGGGNAYAPPTLDQIRLADLCANPMYASATASSIYEGELPTSPNEVLLTFALRGRDRTSITVPTAGAWLDSLSKLAAHCASTGKLARPIGDEIIKNHIGIGKLDPASRAFVGGFVALLEPDGMGTWYWSSEVLAEYLAARGLAKQDDNSVESIVASRLDDWHLDANADLVIFLAAELERTDRLRVLVRVLEERIQAGQDAFAIGRYLLWRIGRQHQNEVWLDKDVALEYELLPSGAVAYVDDPRRRFVSGHSFVPRDQKAAVITRPIDPGPANEMSPLESWLHTVGSGNELSRAEGATLSSVALDTSVASSLRHFAARTLTLLRAPESTIRSIVSDPVCAVAVAMAATPQQLTSLWTSMPCFDKSLSRQDAVEAVLIRARYPSVVRRGWHSLTGHNLLSRQSMLAHLRSRMGGGFISEREADDWPPAWDAAYLPALLLTRIWESPELLSDSETLARGAALHLAYSAMTSDVNLDRYGGYRLPDIIPPVMSYIQSRPEAVVKLIELYLTLASARCAMPSAWFVLLEGAGFGGAGAGGIFQRLDADMVRVLEVIPGLELVAPLKVYHWAIGWLRADPMRLGASMMRRYLLGDGLSLLGAGGFSDQSLMFQFHRLIERADVSERSVLLRWNACFIDFVVAGAARRNALAGIAESVGTRAGRSLDSHLVPPREWCVWDSRLPLCLHD